MYTFCNFALCTRYQRTKNQTPTSMSPTSRASVEKRSTWERRRASTWRSMVVERWPRTSAEHQITCRKRVTQQILGKTRNRWAGATSGQTVRRQWGGQPPRLPNRSFSHLLRLAVACPKVALLQRLIVIASRRICNVEIRRMNNRSQQWARRCRPEVRSVCLLGHPLCFPRLQTSLRPKQRRWRGPPTPDRKQKLEGLPLDVAVPLTVPRDTPPNLLEKPPTPTVGCDSLKGLW